MRRRRGYSTNGNRIRSQKGFSLTEMLVTVLLMSLATLAIAAGVTAAVRTYRSMTLKAEAQTLLGTAIAAVDDDFASADLTTLTIGGDGNEASFFSGNRGYDDLYDGCADAFIRLFYEQINFGGWRDSDCHETDANTESEASDQGDFHYSVCSGDFREQSLFHLYHFCPARRFRGGVEDGKNRSDRRIPDRHGKRSGCGQIKQTGWSSFFHRG